MNNIFTECKSDGTLGIYELKEKSFDIKKLPAESRATCFCWSPKGKQIAVGSQDGRIIHYKPDLKAVKGIDAPPFDKPHGALSLQWISNYQFVAVYKVAEEEEPECCVVLIDAPKTGNPVFSNFYDICYSNGTLRPPQFYLLSEHHWNLLLVSSANSMEVAVLSNTADQWTQCILPDSARAELPLDENQDETYPVGVAIDTSSVKPVLWGEAYLQPHPSLVLLSHEGVMCCFRMINLKEGAPSATCPPDKVNDLSGLKYFVAEVQEDVKEAREEVQQLGNTEQKKVGGEPEQAAPQISTIQSPSPQIFAASQAQQPQTQTTPLSIFKSSAPRQPPPTLSTNLFGSGGVSLTPVKGKDDRQQQITPAGAMGAKLLQATTPDQFVQVSRGPSNAQSFNFTSGNNPTASQGQQGNYAASSLATPPSASIGSQKTETKPVQNVTQQIQQQQQHQKNTETKDVLNEEESPEVKQMITRMIYMECMALNQELKSLIIQGQRLKINLNSEEMEQIVLQTEGINEFLRELVETCDVQSSEIHALKQTTIQSWAWLEEAKSRYKDSRNEELRTLMKSKPLDSVSEKHLTTLKQMQYYLGSQLKQSHKSLDDQWERFQDYCRNTNKMQLPTMEAIFQTMVKQNAILQRHNYILKDISSQVKGKQKACNDAALFNPSDKKDNLETTFQNLKLEPESIHQIYHQKVMNRVKTLPPNKTNHLRRILHNREVPHVMAKSQMSTSILNSSLKLDQYKASALKTPTGKNAPMESAKSSPFNITSAPQISSTPLSAFANNSTPTGKPQSRFSTEFQGTVPSFNLKLNQERSEKQSVVPEGQNSSFSIGDILGSKSTISPQPLRLPGSTTSQPVSGTLSSGFKTFATSKGSELSNLLAAKAGSIGTTQSGSTFSSMSNMQSPTPPTTSGLSFNTAAPPSFSFGPPKTTPVMAASSTTSTLTGLSKIDSKITSSIDLSKQTSVPKTTPSLSFFQTASSNAPVSTTSTTPGSSMAPILNLSSKVVPGSSMFGTGLFGTSAKTNQETATTSQSATPKSQPSIFGIASEKTASTASPSFGSTVTTSSATVGTKPTFGSPLTTTTSSTSISSSTGASSIFSTLATSGTSGTTKSIFGSSTPTTTSSTSLPSSTSSIFGTTVPASSTVETTKSIFGSSTSTTSSSAPTSTPSLFGTSVPASTTVGTSKSLFGSLGLSSTGSIPVPASTPSIFGTSVSSSGTVGPSKSIFGTSTPTSSTGAISSTSGTPSIFGTSVSTSTTVGTTKSIFGSSTPTATSSTGGVSTTTSTPSIFGTSASTSTTVGTTKSIFSSSTPTATSTTVGISSTSTPSIFGTSASTTTTVGTTKSIFGTSVTTTTPGGFSSPTSTPSIFGTSVSSGSTKSVFGTQATASATLGTQSTTGTPVTTSASIFGSATPSSGPFGAASQAAVPTSTTSIFGTAVSSSAAVPPASTKSIFASASPSVFGTTKVESTQSGTAPATGTSSLFGSSASFATTSGSIFGNAAATGSTPFAKPASSPFGTAAATGTQPAFGQATTASPFSGSSAAASPFGGTPANAQSPFSTPPRTSDSLFGGTTPAVCSPFGGTQGFGTQAAPFGQPSTFGGSTTPSAGFGGSTTSGSVFGGSTTSGSAFGGSTTSGSAFGGGATSGTPFGGSTTSGSAFGGAANSSTGSFGFGGLNMGQSAQSPFSKTNETKSPFGGTTFNPTTSAGSLFGSPSPGFGNNNGNNVFRQSTFGSTSAFGGGQQQSGPFSGGGGSIAQAGFGVAQNAAKAPAFGGAPSFGGTPAFGAAPTFGGAPAFGSTSPFGGASKTGFSSEGSGFGSFSQQSSGFGSFGGQSSSGFGGLAQQTNNANQNTQQSAGFGTFASQNTIGFGNLAQQTNSQNSSFSGNSSFSSWR